jgi:hypothetical protein
LLPPEDLVAADFLAASGDVAITDVAASLFNSGAFSSPE